MNRKQKIKQLKKQLQKELKNKVNGGCFYDNYKAYEIQLKINDLEGA